MRSYTYSVVVPAYNAEKFIINCLDSIVNQTYKEFEIVIVNDGSKDNTEAIVQEYIKNHEKCEIRYIFQKNGGAAAARGTGVEASTKEYIAFLDADDVWYPEKLEKVNQCVNKFGATVYYNDEYEISLDGRKKYVRYRMLSATPLDDLIINGNALSTSTVVVEAELLKSNNTFKEGRRAGEDIQCWIALAKAGGVFWHIPEALGEYRRTSNSLTLGSPQYIRETNEMLLDFYDLLDDTKYTKEEIEKLKVERKSLNAYTQGRCLHVTGEYAKAKEEYRKAKKLGMNGIKIQVAMILANLRIKR